MPETMLKKVSQSQALRQAFAISGVYSPEEMDTGFRGEIINTTPIERYVPPADTLQTKEEKQWIKDAREKDAKKKQENLNL